MVDLLGADPNKYQTLLAYKSHLEPSSDCSTNCPRKLIVANAASKCKTIVNNFGEDEVIDVTQAQKRNFTTEETRQIILDYQTGMLLKEIAAKFECSRQTISKLLKEHGINVTTAKKQAKLNPKEVIAMYEQMHTSEEIGKHFGVRAQVIIACLKSNGVPLRSRWDYYKK